MDILFYFLVCIFATTIGGISGVGGGVIIKPVMDAVSGMSVTTISFLSGCTVLAMTVTAMLRSRGDSVKIEWKRGSLLAAGAVVGGISGKALFELAREAGGSLVNVIDQILMILLTLGVLIYTINRSRITSKNVKAPAECVAIGLVLGLLSAFLGIGGGPINLALLYYFFSMDSKTAALNSLYIILFSQSASLLTTLIRGKVPDFRWSVFLVMIIGGVCGSALGRWISRRLDNKGVDRLFFFLLLGITAISGWNLYCCF